MNSPQQSPILAITGVAPGALTIHYSLLTGQAELFFGTPWGEWSRFECVVPLRSVTGDEDVPDPGKMESRLMRSLTSVLKSSPPLPDLRSEQRRLAALAFALSSGEDVEVPPPSVARADGSVADLIASFRAEIEALRASYAELSARYDALVLSSVGVLHEPR